MAKSGKRLGLEFTGWKDMIERIDKMGGNVRQATEEALQATADIVRPKMLSEIKKHHRTGQTEKSFHTEGVQWEGNTAYIKCGFEFDKGGFVAVYLNYGTPKMKPDPDLLTNPLNQKTEYRKKQKEIIMKYLESSK